MWFCAFVSWDSRAEHVAREIVKKVYNRSFFMKLTGIVYIYVLVLFP